MASCDYYIELLSAGLDGQLSQEQEQELARHLLECPYCRELGPRLAAAHAAFADLEEIPAPQGFAEGVMKEIRARENTPKVVPLFKRPVWKAVAGLAACCVLCVGLYQSRMLGQPHADSEAAGQTAMVRELVGAEAAVYAAESEDTDGTEQSAVGSVFSIGVTYGSTPAAPMACVLDDTALKEFLKQFPEDDHLTDLLQQYGEDYFRTGRVLALVLEENSSSITHQITSVTPEQVTILRQIPEECSDDMAAWLILAEVDADFQSGEVLRVVVETK